MTQLYAKDVGAQPKYPDAVTSLKPKPEIVAAKIEFLTHGMRERLVVGDAELKALGQQRAMALQQALLADTQIDSDGCSWWPTTRRQARTVWCGLELSLAMSAVARGRAFKAMHAGVFARALIRCKSASGFALK